jgi:Tol biopolymer transport system component/DNA-binding winged helix-turn-helix (wHTH) protein
MLTAGPEDPLYRFGSFLADPAVSRLYHDGDLVLLTPKAFLVLMVLVEGRGQLVDKDELFRRVWPDTFVEPNNLARNISMIRKVLHEHDPDSEYIVTVSRRGYRFTGQVSQIARSAAAGHPHASAADASILEPRQLPGDLVPATLAELPRTLDPSAQPPTAWQRTRPLVSIGMLAAALLGIAGTLVTGAREAASTGTSERRLWQLTTTGRLHAEPTWSPDGQMVAYASDRGGDFDIWVQKVSGGSPVQITSDAARDWQPSWSPDGRHIAYRSERNGGGIFVVPAEGGSARRIAESGYNPLWSPDGSRILFWEGREVYLIGLDGRPPVRIAAGGPPHLIDPFSIGWHPDGSRISLYGYEQDHGWSFWTVPLAGGPGVRSHIAPAVARRLRDASMGFGGFVWAPGGDALYFEGRSERTQNVWRVRVDPRTLEWISGPDRLTTSSGLESGLTLSPDGKRLAFGSRVERTHVWSLPFDPVSGRITGDGEAITPDGSDARILDISPDGQQLVYRVTGRNSDELWIRSLDRQADRLRRVEVDAAIVHPRWSRDGRRLAYLRRPTNRAQSSAVVLLAANGDEEQYVVPAASSTEMVYDWGLDGGSFLVRCRKSARPAICRLSNVPTAGLAPEMQLIASDADRNLYAAAYSPDGRWVSFIAAPDRSRSTVFVSPAAGGPWVPITQTDDHTFEDLPRWSPDGRTLYFLSNRTGFWNLFGRRFNPDTGTPLGEIFQVSRFDSSLQMVSNVSGLQMAVTHERLILPVTQTTGAVWVLENVDR